MQSHRSIARPLLAMAIAAAVLFTASAAREARGDQERFPRPARPIHLDEPCPERSPT